MKHFLFILLISFANILFAQDKSSWYMPFLEEARALFNYSNEDNFIVAKLSTQELYLIQNEKIINCFSISGSKYGAGSKAGSNKTPLGFHKVKFKFGDNAPKGAIFKARKFTGEIANIYTDKTDVEEDHVTTRILWLDGLEEGKNSGNGVSSFNRFIYIHGTPEEGLIGQPASHGCIRMYNDEVIELYGLVEVGTIVLIID